MAIGETSVDTHAHMHTCTALCNSVTDASESCRAPLLVSTGPPAVLRSPLTPPRRSIWPASVPPPQASVLHLKTKPLMKMSQTAGSSSVPAAPAPLLPSLAKAAAAHVRGSLHAHTGCDLKACLCSTWSEFQNAGHISKIEFVFV